jgi:D-3-phosphoglycerate dehydrogenase
MQQVSFRGTGRKVLVTDYAWKSLDLERQILNTVGATLVVGGAGDEDELTQLAVDVDGILTCWKRVTEKVIRNAPRCQAIGRYGIGLDNIDVRYASQSGIVVTNVPHFCLEEVSDHAMALLLSLARKVTFYDRAVKAGIYDLQAGPPLHRIRGQTLGIVGFGKTARSLSLKAHAFGLKVLVHTRHHNDKQLAGYAVEPATFDDLLARSDYVSIHVPLTAETLHLFNLEVFRRMKPTAFVINTSRGDVIEAQALLKALDQGLIAGAALDVLSMEPPQHDDPLVLHPRTIITPHAAFNSAESLEELQRTAASQIANVLSGTLPSFIVNPEVLAQPNLRATFR